MYSKFNDMDVMAILLASLRTFHRPFVISLMDQIFEELDRSFERNDFKESQRRIALIKFIGECYNYRVVRTNTLFDLLYRLINVNWNQASFSITEFAARINHCYYGGAEVDESALQSYLQRDDEHMRQLDSSQDSFRIRLICTLLDSLGKFFQRGERKKIMDRFLLYLQRYIFSKTYVLMDLEFMILDTFDTLRSGLIRFQSLEEAEEVCKKVEEREGKGADIADILSRYQKDGGGYDQLY